MIDPAEALARLLALAPPVDTETLPILEATGHYAAAPVLARRTQPARDLSAMDGYAIRFADGPGPWRVVGESAAGTPFAGRLVANDAARIFTGAALPEGADTVIIQEEVTRTADSIALTGHAHEGKGTHVRFAGSDFTTGQLLIDTGMPLTAARIGLAAVAGHATLLVRRRIRVALISTGDELVPLGCDPGQDRLPASNAVMLAALLANLPVDITDFGIIPDDRVALRTAFTQAADYDILVTTGGASVGDHDLVRPALLDAGASMDFWKIAMRPGKPMMAGRLGKAVALGLPGNPVSAFVTATLFLKPLIAQRSGAADPVPSTHTAILAADLPKVGARTDYVRAHWVGAEISPLGGDSGMLVPLAAAAALIIRPAASPQASAGESVTVIPLA
jgi:molybdopterin molybdotransferase